MTFFPFVYMPEFHALEADLTHVPPRPTTLAQQSPAALKTAYPTVIEKGKTVVEWMKKHKDDLNGEWWALNPRQCYDWRGSGRKNLTRDMSKFAHAALIETIRTESYREDLLRSSASARRLRLALQDAWQPFLSPPRQVKFHGSKTAEPLAKGYVYPDLLVVKIEGEMKGGGVPEKVDMVRILADRQRKAKDDELRKQLTSAIIKIQGLPAGRATPNTKLLNDGVREALDNLVEVTYHVRF